MTLSSGEQQFRSLEFCRHPSPSLQGTRRSWLSILGIYNARYWTGDKSDKLSINGRCSGKKITSVQVCDYVSVTFCLIDYKNFLCEFFPHVAQLVEHLTCNAKVTGSIPGNMLLKFISSKSPQTHISWLFNGSFCAKEVSLDLCKVSFR